MKPLRNPVSRIGSASNVVDSDTDIFAKITHFFCFSFHFIKISEDHLLHNVSIDIT